MQGKFNEISVDQPRDIHNVAYTYLVAYAPIYHPIYPTHQPPPTAYTGRGRFLVRLLGRRWLKRDKAHAQSS